jgi:two-component system response regulator RegX3
MSAAMTDTPKKILVIEDEESIRVPLVDALEDEGFSVLVAADGEAGLTLGLREDPDLILLDLMLPGLDGFELLSALRADRVTAPVVILSARGEEWDRVQGFKLGADDYVVKPFSTRELLLRVRAQLERASGRTPGLDEAPTELAFGAVKVDLAGYTLTRDGTTVLLSRRELELLHFFAAHAGAVFTRDQLLDQVWGRDSASGPRTVDTHILKLRKKIEADPEAPRHLVTVRNVGYKFLT